MSYAVAALVAAAFVWAAWTFNRLIGLRNRMRAAWGDVDALLKRRADLIPNLVAAVGGYAGHEERTLARVTDARAEATAVSDAGPEEAGRRAEAEDRLSRRLQQLMVVVEEYPELRASANFLELQAELTGTEDDIAHARRYYNAVVRDYDTMRERFPHLLIARPLGFRPGEYFEVETVAEREAPDVGAGEAR